MAGVWGGVSRIGMNSIGNATSKFFFFLFFFYVSPPKKREKKKKNEKKNFGTKLPYHDE